MSSDTKLLLHCDGADTSTTFDDTSASNHTVTAQGNAQVDTDQSVFGGASGIFDGTGDYLSAPTHADFTFAGNDFTVDFRARFAAISGEHGFLDQNFTTRSWNITFDSNELIFNWSTDGSGLNVGNRAWTPSTDTWYHIALVRSGTVVKLFVDGSQLGIDIPIGSDVIWTPAVDLYIAATHSGDTTAGSFLNGWMDEIRISSVARWTSNFTPPTSEYTPGAVTPSVLAISASVLTPADVTDNTMLPSAFAISASILTPTVPVDFTIFPNAFAISATLLAPDVVSVVEASALAITATLPAPTTTIFNPCSLEADLPAHTLEARIPASLTLEQNLPALTLEASCRSGQLLTLEATLPALTLISHMGMRMEANLPALTLSSTLTSGGVASLNRILPALTLVASMTSGRSMSLTTNLAALTLSANLVNGNLLTLAQTLPALTLEALSTTGNNMSLSKNLPTLTLVSTVNSSENLTLTATLPALELEAFMDNYLDRYI